MKRLWACYAPYHTILFFVIAGSVLTAGLEISFPMIVRYILEDILPAGDMLRLVHTAAVLFILYVVCLCSSFCVSYFGRSMGTHIENDLRCRLFSHIESMSFSFFDNAKTGQLLSRIISDISEIGDLVFQMPNLIMVCLITMCGSAFFLFYINWQLAIFVLFLILLKTGGTMILNRRMKETFRTAREKMGLVSSQAMESLNAIRLVQSFCNEAVELKKFVAASDKLRRAQQRTFMFEAYLTSSVIFFSNLTNLVIIAAGSFFIMLGVMSLGDLVAFLMYLMVFIRPIMQLTMLTERYQRGLAGYRRYEELMAIEPDVADKTDAVEAGVIEGRVAFEDVSFSYNGKDLVLRRFSLDIPRGKTVAIVGPTGAGKSSVASLLLRFYDIQSGCITLDGRDIRQYTLASLRRSIGIVQQDVFLFSDSIRENIAYGRPDATEQEIIEAAKLADAHEFIMKLPDGYDSAIGERGVKLSGGQKQRLAIARVFLKNPPVLILDEATSALDNETERKIQQALQDLSHNRTTLVIAHRLATIRHADSIVVLTKEGICEQGTHGELMERKGLYYELYMSQFDK
ncbi:ABC transporter ATP-binding protein/permease [Megasphaera butyrica]|uniref:ABC transporter ATP-binding protein n=1 Tax=Megasphaera butyrica TaxID=2981791 RepID=UPI0008214B1F|nr:ABC transporter ATP-binding protein [Megasphaera butyrica]MCU6715394.1 ABC transporter ATP-binding protein/permease [Megasphaera butyrica]SCI06566.1 Putative multidrug export ATP-binding/permease protein SAV1866 [uncultured Megasphaera sp.]